jgi:hypothetical protein
MPTQTHVFVTAAMVTAILSIAHVWSSAVAEISIREGLEGLPWVQTTKLITF